MAANERRTREFGRRSSEFSLSPSRTWSLLFDSEDNVNKSRTPFNDPRRALPVDHSKNRRELQGVSGFPSPSEPSGIASDVEKPLAQFQPTSPFRLPKVTSGGNTPDLPTAFSVESNKSSTSMRDAGIQTSFEIPSSSPNRPVSTNLSVGKPSELSILRTKHNLRQIPMSPTELTTSSPSERRILMTTTMSPTQLLKSPSPKLEDVWTQTTPKDSSSPSLTAISPREQRSSAPLLETGVQTIKQPSRRLQVKENSPTVLSSMISPPHTDRKTIPSSPSQMSSISRALSKAASERRMSAKQCQLCPHETLVASMLAAMQQRPRKCPWPEASTVYSIGESTGIVIGSVAEAIGSLALGILTGVSRSVLDTHDAAQKSEWKERTNNPPIMAGGFRQGIQSKLISADVFDGIICVDLPSDVIGVPIQSPEENAGILPARTLDRPSTGYTNLNIMKGATWNMIPPSNMTETFVSVIPPEKGKI